MPWPKGVPTVSLRHGQCRRGLRTREFGVWASMRQRCLNTDNPAWHNYGGRGITICLRWLESFDNFFADMGVCPPGLTLERLDNDKGYEPSNCVWSTRKAQMRNTRLT